MLVAAALSVGSGGCHRRIRPEPELLPVATAQAARVLEELRREERSVVRYQAVVKVRGKGPEGGFSVTQVVVFERPDRMRVELVGAFGSTRWVAVTSGGEILVFVPPRRQFLRERRIRKVVGALLGVELSPREVMAVLAGSGLPLEGQIPSKAFRQGGRLEIELGEATVEIEGAQVRTVTRPGYRVSYPTPWKDRGKQVPDRVRLEAGEVQATLSIEDLDVNVPLNPQVFTVELPEGAERLELAQIGGEAIFVKPKS